MSGPRFFSAAPLGAAAIGTDVELPENVARHVTQVLRLRDGAPLVLFDGRGGEYVATLTAVERRRAVARLLRHDPVERESTHPVTLVQGVIAADMMDLVVRKAVELGAAAIVPVQAARSQGLSDERAEKRLAHWRAIAVAACEQCGRNRVPPVASLEPLAAWLAGGAMPATTWVMTPDAPRSFAAARSLGRPGAILVGPEGGFEPGEVAAAVSRGALPVRLGVRTLRAETAALAALAALEAGEEP